MHIVRGMKYLNPLTMTCILTLFDARRLTPASAGGTLVA